MQSLSLQQSYTLSTFMQTLSRRSRLAQAAFFSAINSTSKNSFDIKIYVQYHCMSKREKCVK